jgi:nucleotide-binding universal stress UspA family protein
MKVEAKKSTTIKTPLKILVPTDFSRNAAEALRFAVPLARQFGAQITLLHVIAWEGNSRLLGAAGLADALNKSAEDPAHRLDKLARTMVPADLLQKTIVRFGAPHVEIPKAARALKMDLIVISTQGRTGLEHVLLGSTAARVVRHASCPVLTVRPVSGAKRAGPKPADLEPVIKRILVPVVMSEECTPSIHFAATLARRLGARLTLLHVIEPLPLNRMKDFPEIRHYHAEAKLDAKERLKALAAAVPEGVKTRVLLREDTPHDGIISAAREDQCDLIVLPTRGLKGLKRFMLGSTAEKVVRHARCPVLTFNHDLAIGGKMTPKSKQSSNRLPEEDHVKQA